MGVNQSSATQSVKPFILGGDPLVKDGQTVLTIAGRTVAMPKYTLMSQIASTGKWAPWLNANLGGTTGTQFPLGILMDDLTAAALAAADVTGVPILVGGAGVLIDSNQIVFDGGDSGGGTLNTLDSIPTVPTNLAMRAEALLNLKGIFPVGTVDLDKTEN